MIPSMQPVRAEERAVRPADVAPRTREAVGGPLGRGAVLAAMLFLAASPARAQSVDLRSGQSWPGAAAPVAQASPTTNGVVRILGPAEGVTIGPASVVGPYRAVETGKGAVLSRSRITGLTARDLQRDGIRLRDATDVEISRFDLAMRAEPQTGRNLPEGIAIYAGSGITIRDGTVSGFRMATVEGRYTNGDGIATEKASSGTILRVVSRNNTDGGFDLKGAWTIDVLTAEGNGKSFRFWNRIKAGTLTSVDGGTAVHLARGADVTIERLVVRSSRPSTVIAVEGWVTLRVLACDLSGVASGSQLVRYNERGNTISLGSTCRLP